MALAENLRTAARSLITTFGNTASIYTYSTATKTTSDEGDVAVSNWGTLASIKIVDGQNARQILDDVQQGRETIGEDERIVQDNATIAINDRLLEDSVNYRVVDIRPIQSQDVTIIKNIQVARVTSISDW